MVRNRLKQFGCAAGLCFLTASGALADPLVSQCRSVVENEDEKFVCQLRSTSGKSLSSISVEQDDGSAVEFTSTPYSWVAHQTAIYFLVQTSEVTEAQLQRFANYLSRAAVPVGKQIMGLATAGAAFQERAELGSYRPRLQNAIGDIETMAPLSDKSVVLRSITDAVQKLSAQEADRKAIFILADPQPSSGGVDENNLINQAQNKDVAIYFIVAGKSGTKRSALIASIANKTNGGIINLTDETDSEVLTLGSKAPERIENGMVLKIGASELPETSTLRFSARVPGDGTLTTAPVEVERQTSARWFSAQKLFGDNLLITLAALVLTSGLALIGLSYLPRRRVATVAAGGGGGSASANNDETRILTQNWSAGQEAAAVAWLDVIDNSDAPLPLAPGSIRIGRSRDNDVQLTNQSVHRHHAILQVSEDGAVSIQDLGTKNGVFVNGSRCNECALCVDDMVELGEVKLRLTSKPS